MNLKQQISKFRSEILIGKYPSALAVAKDILHRLDLVEDLGIMNTQQLKVQVQMEYEKCLVLSSLTKGLNLKEEDNVKKWGGRTPERKTKWGKKGEEAGEFMSPIGMRSSHRHENPPALDLSLESTVNTRQYHGQYTIFMDRLEKEIMLPLKMPSFFPDKSTLPKAHVVRSRIAYYSEIIDCFVQNDFARLSMDELLTLVDEKDGGRVEGERRKGEVVAECKEEQVGRIGSLRLEGYQVVLIVASDRFTLEHV